eukprot:scaffold82651_cov27-Phaeocystis_antarctica.AAC.1
MRESLKSLNASALAYLQTQVTLRRPNQPRPVRTSTTPTCTSAPLHLCTSAGVPRLHGQELPAWTKSEPAQWYGRARCRVQRHASTQQRRLVYSPHRLFYSAHLWGRRLRAARGAADLDRWQ